MTPQPTIPQIGRTYTFTSKQEDVKFNFRKLRANEIMRLVQNMPKVEEDRQPTPEESMQTVDAVCEALACASRDGYSAEQFKQLDLNLIFEAYKFLFDISVNTAQVKSMLSQRSTTLIT